LSASNANDFHTLTPINDKTNFVITPLKTEEINTHIRQPKSPKPFTYKEIQDRYNFIPKQRIKYTNDNKILLHDLSCTLSINLKEISNIKNIGSISAEQMEIIQKRISVISELFKKMRKNQKTINNIKKNLCQKNQLIAEIETQQNKEKNNIKIKSNELRKSIDTKDIEIKKYQNNFKKFENFIQKESQSYDKYGKLYKFFSMDEFIRKNIYLLRRKKAKKHENEIIDNLINILKCDNKIYNSLYYNKNNKIINNRGNDINNFIMIENHKNIYYEKEIDELNKIYKSIYKNKSIINIVDETKSNNKKKFIFSALDINKNNSYLLKNNNFYSNSEVDSSEISSD
jgi:hypothetical protein